MYGYSAGKRKGTLGLNGLQWSDVRLGDG